MVAPCKVLDFLVTTEYSMPPIRGGMFCDYYGINMCNISFFILAFFSYFTKDSLMNEIRVIY